MENILINVESPSTQKAIYRGELGTIDFEFYKENVVDSGIYFRILNLVCNPNSKINSERVIFRSALGEMGLEIKKEYGAPGVNYKGFIDNYGNAFTLTVKREY